MDTPVSNSLIAIVQALCVQTSANLQGLFSNIAQKVTRVLQAYRF